MGVSVSGEIVVVSVSCRYVVKFQFLGGFHMLIGLNLLSFECSINLYRSGVVSCVFLS